MHFPHRPIKRGAVLNQQNCQPAGLKYARKKKAAALSDSLIVPFTIKVAPGIKNQFINTKDTCLDGLLINSQGKPAFRKLLTHLSGVISQALQPSGPVSPSNFLQ